MNIRKILIPHIPRLLALASIGAATLGGRWLVTRFSLSPELAAILSDQVVDLLLGAAFLGIAALKLGDNAKVGKLVEAERVKVAAAIQPRRRGRPAPQEDNRG